MKTTRYATSRQKACQQCVIAKARCDHNARICGRCVQRGLSCIYPRAISSEASTRRTRGHDDAEPYSPFSASAGGLLLTPEREIPVGDNSMGQTMTGSVLVNNCATTATKAQFPLGPKLHAAVRMSADSKESEALNFSSLDLVCPIDVDSISNRWLNVYIPVPGQALKEYPAHINAFIYRILKSFAAATIGGHGIPPFLHSSQMVDLAISPPLSACLSLVRICQTPLPGSDGVVADILQREMNNLYEQHGTYDDMVLLAAFQAYLIYAMVLFFQLRQGSHPFLRQAMMNLQELACASSRRGLMCSAELQHVRPRWEAWIVAEAKRRTLYTMYLFDSVLSTQDGLPTFLGTELRGLLAPANKLLWQAQSRHEWEVVYNLYLAEWTGGGLRIDELWPIPADLAEAAILERRSRVDKWLENLDEYGTMLYAVTSCTHGG
ncbi:uncharacterized protein Z518_03944 [Rhinocladiella mackenziei CBS 650.93]|uniref:Zn(2)-C6 fungal-type domain-containing protein n=1 Tax=Rhinocladiella mackenziei CBS 650.93 TaxID=1442369 RepID=A0A0D2JA22_9EURO|nr:uncharacterized protein Z518_03944 [Rhinocladiella mackenziei CBS 650.93]KIX05970.1 hypothetical protein Z518_03944 [Rhinocladiella mackenziei CBS 650.93]